MAAVAAPADKHFRRKQLTPARKRSVSLRRGWRYARSVLVAVAIAYAAWFSVHWILTTPVLQVAAIEVHGNERLSNGEILALVAELPGRSILLVDLAVERARLLSSPWVADAELRRLLPARITITVRERQPMGLARLHSTAPRTRGEESGLLYLVDAHGVVIDEYGPQYAALDLPIIDGLAGPPDRNTGVASAVDPARARLAARVVATLGSDPALADRISQIDVADQHDATVMLAGDTVLLHLGEGHFGERIKQYLDLAPVLRERVAEIDYVDLRFDERLYVRPLIRSAR